MRIILNVPYEEKDTVRKLGAKWNGKRWYVPDGIDFHPFSRWMETDSYRSIDELLLQYKQKFQTSLPTHYITMIGDICRIYSTGTETDGYTYLDLTNSPYAKPYITVHINQFIDYPSDIRIKLTGLLAMQDGHLQIKADKNNITVLQEPTAFQKTIKKWSASYPPIPSSRGKEIPVKLNRIGIISTAAQDAGYSDFIETLKKDFEKIPPLFGSLKAESLAKRIKELDKEDLDYICIIRGGGTMYDLLDFNNPIFIQAICDARHPIGIGIGHSTDDLACNRYASLSAITPTDLANKLNRLHWKAVQKEKKQIPKKSTTDSRFTQLQEENLSLKEENAYLKSELERFMSLYKAEVEKKKKTGFFSKLFSLGS
jgi:exodeoxyribonuclease VII, large subunit